MSIYAQYLPELQTATLFCDMTPEEILRVLDTLQPPIKQGSPELGKEGKPASEEAFRMVLRSRPARDLAPRHFKYDMPRFGEPGMLMAEIPVLSRMKEYVQGKDGPMGPFGQRPNVELETLEFTPDMLTRFYTPEASAAQGKMLRNLLGILSQKVCDIRQELFLLKDGRDMYHGLTLPPEAVLHILTAGVAMNSVKRTVRVWNALHPELPAVWVSGGSVNLIRAVQEGEPCDVLISADEGLLDTLLIPEHASGYRVFAGNRMVVMGSPEHPISKADWKEKLLAPEATFGHSNPHGDPGGYRAVMAMLLADTQEAGLGERLMKHPGRRDMERDSRPGEDQPRYTFGYHSGALGRGVPFAELPPEMDLSEVALAKTYARVSFAIDAERRVQGAPIAHALTIPKGARHREAAKAFAHLFLETDFTEAGFLERSGISGEDPLA